MQNNLLRSDSTKWHWQNVRSRRRRVILIFFCDGHNDVFTVYEAEQDGGIQSSQVVRGGDEIPFRHFFDAV